MIVTDANPAFTDQFFRAAGPEKFLGRMGRTDTLAGHDEYGSPPAPRTPSRWPVQDPARSPRMELPSAKNEIPARGTKSNI